MTIYRASSVLLILAASLLFQGCGKSPRAADPPRLRVASVEPVAELDRLMDLQPVGWLGSDVTHSVPLSDDRIVWIYADTWLGEFVNGRREVDGPFIHSSIGIQDLSSGYPGSMTFHWGPDRTSFIEKVTDIDATFYWPTMGFTWGGELYILSYAIETGETFGFRLNGTTITRVRNPMDHPAEWKMTTEDFGMGHNHMGIHTAVHVEEEWVYFMGFEDTGGRRAILARARGADIQASRYGEALEFWVNRHGEQRWDPKPVGLATLFRPGNTESAIQYDSAWDLYYTLTYIPEESEIYLTAAHDLTGPWSEPIVVYDVPEHQAVDFPIMSYAVRSHPFFSTQPGELVISYATNTSGTVDPLFTEAGASIYRPRFIRLQMEKGQ